MDTEWRDEGKATVEADRAARDVNSCSFLETLRYEIQAYAKKVCDFLSKPDGSAEVPEVPKEYAFNENAADDLEHDQLLYRVQTNQKSPRLQPKVWLSPAAESCDESKYRDYLQKNPPTTKVRGDLDISLLKCLEPLNWLNDEVMNAYVDLINSACQELGLKVHCWNTFFWPNLTGSEGRDYDYDKVRRWTKRRHIDIFSLDLLFIPLHVNHVHWSLGLVDLKSRLIFFFDSLGHQAPDHYIKTVRKYLQDEWQDKQSAQHDGMELNPSDYLYAGNNFALSMLSAPTCHYQDCLLEPNGDVRRATLPKQQNGSDCGVFTCLFMRELAFNRFPFHFSENMESIRLMMLRDIVEGHVTLPV